MEWLALYGIVFIMATVVVYAALVAAGRADRGGKE